MSVVSGRAPYGGPATRRQLARMERRLLAMLTQLKLKQTEVSLMLVGDAAIRKINAQWRGKDKATDVLSFPSGAVLPSGVRWLGDIVVSLSTARRQAKRFGMSLDAELDLYLAHGLLHLLGHDHHEPEQAREMARLERKLVGRGGMLARSDEL